MPENTSALTELTLRNLKPPPSGQLTVWDAMPNFGVRVSAGGAKTFIVLLGRGRRHTIGRYPIISLADARTEAKRVLAERTLGNRQHNVILFEVAFPKFIKAQYQGRRLRSKNDTEWLLKRHFLPKFRHDELHSIRAYRVAEIIDDLSATPSQQRHALTAIGTFFRWAISREYAQSNPGAGIKLAKRPGRTRVLSDDELVAVWHATAETTEFNRMVRLLILTGQRRGEVGHLKGEYIDRKERTITLPGDATKNGRVHTFPLGALAFEILKPLPATGDLFLGPTGLVFSAWVPEKRALDKRCPIAHWTLHDLRRTYATNLAALGTAPHVVEKLLNHSSGIISGIAAVYNKFQYKDEMKAAIEAWETRLATLDAGHEHARQAA